MKNTTARQCGKTMSVTFRYYTEFCFELGRSLGLSDQQIIETINNTWSEEWE